MRHDLISLSMPRSRRRSLHATNRPGRVRAEQSRLERANPRLHPTRRSPARGSADGGSSQPAGKWSRSPRRGQLDIMCIIGFRPTPERGASAATRELAQLLDVLRRGRQRVGQAPKLRGRRTVRHGRHDILGGTPQLEQFVLQGSDLAAGKYDRVLGQSATLNGDALLVRPLSAGVSAVPPPSADPVPVVQPRPTPSAVAHFRFPSHDP